jgi:7-carboxy-7-deazaguanine synthase
LQDIGPLVDDLHAKGFRVGLETNGTQAVLETLDWVCVSPKPPHYSLDARAAALANELKLVVDDEIDYRIIQRLWNETGLTTPVVLQPESGREDMTAKILACLRKEPCWRLGVQLHKVIGVK